MKTQTTHPGSTPTKRQELIAGARDTLPLIVGAIPFGILFGALAIASGVSWWAAIGLSTIVFAGSSQFVAAGLVGQGASVGVIVLTTFVVNLRHGLYSASLGPYMRHLSHRWLAPLAFLLTDETYAVVIQRYERADSSPLKHWYYLGSALFMYANWQLCTVIGIVTGTRLHGLADLGLEFAMIVTFIGIVVPLIRNYPMLVCALVASVVALLLNNLPHQLGLMAGSIAGIVAGLIALTFQQSRPSSPDDAPADQIDPGLVVQDKRESSQ